MGTNSRHLISLVLVLLLALTLSLSGIPMSNQAGKLFLEACGVDGSLVLGVEEPGVSAVSWRVFDQPFVVVGRGPGVDLHLNDPRVSRRHAYLQVIAGRLFIIDLQSRTGTCWNGEPGSWGWIAARSVITVGPFRLFPRQEGAGRLARPTDDQADFPVPISRAFEQANRPEVSLEILGGDVPPTTWRISRSLVLCGASSVCKLRLQGRGVSSIHASLLQSPAGLFLVDLLGKEGTFVNGTRVRSARLVDGDVVAMGESQFRVRFHSSATTDSAPLALEHRGSEQKSGLPARMETVGPPQVTTVAGLDLNTVAMVRAMLTEFGQVHGRATDRFQESIMTVLQSFIAMHGDQMSLIRAEMDQIRHLSEEQSALQRRMENGSLGSGLPTTMRLVQGESRIATGPPATRNPTMISPRSGPRTRPDLILKESSRPVVSRPAGPPEPGRDSQDLHGQIIHRIATIQEERQGRWQKLLKTLLD